MDAYETGAPPSSSTTQSSSKPPPASASSASSTSTTTAPPPDPAGVAAPAPIHRAYAHIRRESPSPAHQRAAASETSEPLYLSDQLGAGLARRPRTSQPLPTGRLAACHLAR
ncbi:hypothetical protein MBM_04597 [Drepanopeziza brunnea f. sp. 'multigermtubi' MB_m1]|uniref:Uncharacterized protein n=1 Tax=Marssonina brunnea f. sp. multigermtubi (strain MB_m1) TaxID=1072389 RepID=K1WHE7_MARBU|nr:uncharacterized protein MBM_04597 [Drepanopeziza brunnea f. sp. 'multigermtubi' MB_m1]EKD17020.1 hypothetical protein MBM_04597 [Drepanopeziza brunnea f. sp. 'multigermtubi' MB_m1]